MREDSNTGVPIGVGGRDSSQLAIAAEELIKAACTHVDSTSLALGKESVESLKELSAGSAALKSSVETKLNTLNQSISNQNTLISDLKAAIEIQSKDQKIQWAISNAEINSFCYYDANDCTNTFLVSSSNLVKLILLAFKFGRGSYVNNGSMSEYFDNSGKEHDAKTMEDGEKLFRDELSKQIHELLGVKPRVEVDDYGYAMYYYS